MSSGGLAVPGGYGVYDDSRRIISECGSIVLKQVDAGGRIGEIHLGLDGDGPFTTGYPAFLPGLFPAIC